MQAITQKEFCQNLNDQWKQRNLLMKSVCLYLFLSVWLRRSIFWQKLAIFRQNGFLLTSFYHFLAWFKKKYQLMEIVSADKSNPKISSGNVMWLLRNTLNTKSYSYFYFLNHFRCFFLRFFSLTGWCKSRGTVVLLSSVKTEMTDTIEIGLKILPQHLCYQKYIVL